MATGHPNPARTQGPVGPPPRIPRRRAGGLQGALCVTLCSTAPTSRGQTRAQQAQGDRFRLEQHQRGFFPAGLLLVDFHGVVYSEQMLLMLQLSKRMSKYAKRMDFRKTTRKTPGPVVLERCRNHGRAVRKTRDRTPRAEGSVAAPGLCPCRVLSTAAGMRNGRMGHLALGETPALEASQLSAPPPPPLAGDPSQRSPDAKAHSPSSLRGLPTANSPDQGGCGGPPPLSPP